MPAIFDPPLSTQRYMWVESFLMQNPQITSMTDVGCGNGRMVNWTKTAPEMQLINCIDADINLLEDEMDRYLRPNLLERLFGRKNSEKEVFINVYQGDIAVPDDRLAADCFTLIEMIEHITLEQVETASKTIFGYYQPKYVIVSTPNREFNHLLNEHSPQAGPPTKPKDPNNKFRHFDHKFEWNRAEFNQWAQYICATYGYEYQLDGVGHMPGKSEPFGPCTQIAVFMRKSIEPTPLNQSALLCFDLLLNKLSVEETEAECVGDREKRRICLLASFSVPGNTHIRPESSVIQSLPWDIEEPVVAGQSSTQEESFQENDSWDDRQDDDDYFDRQEENEDCDMEVPDQEPYEVPPYTELAQW